MKNKLFHFIKSFDDIHDTTQNWWKVMEDAVQQFNQKHGTFYDPLELVIEYLEEGSSNDNRTTKTTSKRH